MRSLRSRNLEGALKIGSLRSRCWNAHRATPIVGGSRARALRPMLAGLRAQSSYFSQSPQSPGPPRCARHARPRPAHAPQRTATPRQGRSVWALLGASARTRGPISPLTGSHCAPSAFTVTRSQQSAPRGHKVCSLRSGFGLETHCCRSGQSGRRRQTAVPRQSRTTTADGRRRTA